MRVHAHTIALPHAQQWKDKSQPKGKGKEKADDDDDEAEEADEEEQAPASKKKRARKGAFRVPCSRATTLTEGTPVGAASTMAKAPARKKKSTAASRKRADQEARAARAAANGGQLSSDEDLRSDWEKDLDGDVGAAGPAAKKARTRTQPARAPRQAKKVAPPPSSTGDDEA